VAVTSEFLAPSGIERLVFGAQIGRAYFSTRPNPGIPEPRKHHNGTSVADRIAAADYRLRLSVQYL